MEAASPKATKRAASPAKPKREERIFLDEWAYSIDMPQAGAVLRKAGCETLDDVKKHDDFTVGAWRQLRAEGVARVLLVPV